MSLIDRILKRRSHYRTTFETVSGRAVLAHLKRLARFGEPPLALGKDGHTDIYATGMAAGRLEMFLRIVAHLSVDDDHLLRLKEEAIDD